tara:strand:- start:77 stop:1225 length:1149 start_codon:yes stop_codon:yes gene_type:complete
MYTGQGLVDDFLAFGYDTGASLTTNAFYSPSRFYKGEPTTNLGPIDLANWGTEGSAQRIATGRTYRDQPTYNCRTTVGEVYRGIDNTISNLRTAAGSGGTVTMSVFVRNDNSSSYGFSAYMGHDFSSTRTIAANSDWQHIQWTVNQSSMNNDYVEFRPYTNNADIYLEMTMPQVEVNKGHATQHTSTTRSNTDSLIDLKRNQTIDLSNTGFTSNADLFHNGTSNYTEISNYTHHQSLAGTIEAVVKLDTNTGNRYVFGAGGTSTYGGSRALRVNSGNWGIVTYGSGTEDWGTGVAAPTNTWQHIAFGWSNTTVYFYINGVRTSTTRTGLVKPLGTLLRVGMPPWSVSSGFHGQIPIIRHYTTLLTEAEMKVNFERIRHRFGI